MGWGKEGCKEKKKEREKKLVCEEGETEKAEYLVRKDEVMM